MKTKMKVRSPELLRRSCFAQSFQFCAFCEDLWFFSFMWHIFVPLRSVKLCCNIDVPLWVMTKLYQKTPPKTGIKETLACYHLFFPFLQQYTSCDSLGNISALASGVKQYLSCISPVPRECFPWNSCKMREVLASCDNGSMAQVYTFLGGCLV